MAFPCDPPLSDEQLHGLDEHKYSCQGKSIIEPIFQVFWNWLVEKIPLWVAPNLLTITGLVLNVISSLLLVHYCPNGKETAPAWVFYFCAAGLFIYQCLDAIDGKQARRTGTSSPMGELFDHGCDSVSTFIVILALACAIQLGQHPFLMFLFCFTSSFVFYSAHWRTYVTGTLQFGLVDVTEGQIIAISAYLVSGAFGQEVWQTKLFGAEVKLVVVAASVSVAWFYTINNLRIILEGGQGKNGSTIADTSVLSPAIPIVFLLFIAYTLYLHTDLFLRHSCLFVITFGVSAAKVTNNLVIAHMSKSPIRLTDRSLVGPLIMLINLYFHSYVNESYTMVIALIFGTFDLVFTSAIICVQICSHMGISCFTIEPKVEVTSKNSN